MSRRLYVPELAQVRDSTCLLSTDERHYAHRVLRLKEDDEVELFDGQGHSAQALLTAEGARLITNVLKHERSGKSMICAIPQPKGERVDWLVEKLTEVGVDTIAWLSCGRAQTRPKKEKRSKRVVLAATRQCGRFYFPEILSMEFQTLLTRGSSAYAVIADPMGAPLARLDSPQSHQDRVLAVGPEGGFSDTEKAQLKASNFMTLNIGSWILRSETAAVVAAAMISSTGKS